MTNWPSEYQAWQIVRLTDKQALWLMGLVGKMHTLIQAQSFASTIDYNKMKYYFVYIELRTQIETHSSWYNIVSVSYGTILRYVKFKRLLYA